MRRYITAILPLVFSIYCITAQTVTFNSMGMTRAKYNLSDIKGIVYTPADQSDRINPADITDLDKFYYPGDPNYTVSYESMFSTESSYNWKYSAQSEHFFVFWDKRFGEDPSKAQQSWARVDIQDLLTKAEDFFHTNIEVLGMAKLGVGKSNLDKYKMQIWLIYDSGWVATGSGYGDVIGALWVTPSTCKPVGSTIAHEIGHSFQYQVYCDKLANGEAWGHNGGFRYGWGGNGGCTYWEQCAQWQSFRNYPSEQFSQDFKPWLDNYNHHFCHEWMRYQSYWLQSYWVMKRGIDTFGNIWRESKSPEDPIQTYIRLYLNGDIQAFWDEYYDYAARMVAYDIDNVRQYRNSQWGASTQYSTSLFSIGSHEYQVSYADCPETAGFNIIRLNTPAAGTTVTVDLKALPVASKLVDGDLGQYRRGDDGNVGGTVRKYNANQTNKSVPDFRFGFVAIVNGVPTYSDMTHGSDDTATFEIPAGTCDLYLVVVPSPAKYTTHAWDVDDLTDEQWPYSFKVTGTDLFGHIDIDPNGTPRDVELDYDINCDYRVQEYTLGTIDLTADGGMIRLAEAFGLQPSEMSAITASISVNQTGRPTEGNIVLGLLQPDGTVAYNYTANVGFYINSDGAVGSWGANSPIWIEYDKVNFVMTYGHKPGVSQRGKLYNIKPCLVYTKGGVQFTAVFNISLQF